MSSLDLLRSIEKAMMASDYDCALHEASDDSPFETLIILLGRDSWGHELAAHISALEQQTQQGFSAQNPKDVFYNIKIHLPILMEIKKNTYNDLSNILCFINNNLELGSFGFNEFESALYFRCHLINRRDQIDPELIVSVLGLILFYFDSQFPAIAQIAEGKETYLSFLEKLSALWKEVEQR